MKDKKLLVIFAFILIIAFVFCGIYLYKEFIEIDDENSENDIYKSDEKINLINNVEPFLFIRDDIKLIYEGGPSHWGSKTVTLSDVQNTSNGKIVNLHVVDESDMKGESPKKEWNQKWEVTKDGSLYIDNKLMLKTPVIVGQTWFIEDYTPVVNAEKKYKAKVKITSVQDNLGVADSVIRNIITTLTIEDLKTIDGNVYTEIREFEYGKGLIKFVATEPTISDFTLSYWLDRTSDVE
ncbi:MAG: hypothetical protein K0R72_1055 [Clostridia bacterium]|jgi:hypothetical protein|nr:hypothetical protein [Clostridia bacterium]